jgi:gamma-glutamylcyclotransferase (GGCT)/AIG2-like uncharacterized protein YtfP
MQTPAASLPLFIYGSLREPGVRARLLGDRAELVARPATLHGYRRLLVPDFDYPFVVPGATEDRVDGELLLGLTDADYAILDRYEDVDDGLYARDGVTVQTPGGPVGAWAYLKGSAASPRLTPAP